MLRPAVLDIQQRRVHPLVGERIRGGVLLPAHVLDRYRIELAHQDLSLRCQSPQSLVLDLPFAQHLRNHQLRVEVDVELGDPALERQLEPGYESPVLRNVVRRCADAPCDVGDNLAMFIRENDPDACWPRIPCSLAAKWNCNDSGRPWDGAGSFR